MDIVFFCPRWGSEAIDFDTFCGRAVDAGFYGIEMGLPVSDSKALGSTLDTLRQHKLALLAQHWETVDADFKRHVEQYRWHLTQLIQTAPLFINAHTGRDWFTHDQNCQLVEIAGELEANSGVKILHETHRSRLTFCAVNTHRYLTEIPEMRIAADFSHWCNVSESFLEDQTHLLDLAIERADHIHARVGFPEGPQVSDPRAPEWQDAVQIHLAWWDRIIQLHRDKGSQRVTITTEFGPAPYMPLLPYTCQPVTSQWDVNVYMKRLLEQRYASMS
jgi:hypothetical protein